MTPLSKTTHAVGLALNAGMIYLAIKKGGWWWLLGAAGAYAALYNTNALTAKRG